MMCFGVRLGHVTGEYIFWKEAKPHTVGIRSDFKRFKARKNAEECVAQVLTLGQPPLPFPDVALYTDGFACLSSGTAGWGVYDHHRPCSDQLGRGLSPHQQYRENQRDLSRFKAILRK